MAGGDDECVVRGPMASLLRLSGLCGCSTLKLEPLGSTYYIARTTKLKCNFSSILIHALNFSLICFHLVAFIYNSDFNSEVSTMKVNVLLALETTVVILITTIATVGETRRMRRLVQYLNSLKRIQKGLNEVHKTMYFDQTSIYNYENRFGKIMMFYMLLYIIWFSITTFVFALCVPDISYAIYVYTYIVLTLEHIYMIHVEAQILFTITIACSVLREVNRAMAEFDSRLDATGSPTSLMHWKYYEIFHKLRDAYVTILETVRRIKRNEGGVFLLLLFNTCFSLYITAYMLMSTLEYRDDTPYNLYRCVKSVLSSTILIMNIFLMVDPCYCTLQAVEDAKVVAGSLICKTSSSYTFFGDLKIFSKQLLFQPAAYTVLNICTFERSLLITILSGITANLVTLWQM